MKTPKLLAALIMVIAPAVLFASSDTDRQIADAAKGSYNYRAVLDNKVHVRVSDGVVTLTGTVQDQDQRTLAEDTVNNLPGVVGVRNKIRVQSDSAEHSDGWIALKIRSILLVRANVSATATKVQVNNGAVLLTGTADNMAQKELTAEYAKDIDGVKSVDNEIVVKEPGSESNGRVSESIDDASITAEVKYALLAHRSTSAIKTKVTTKDGTVMVSGEASSDAEKDLVTKLAGSVRGVKSVDNDMTVKS